MLSVFRHIPCDHVNVLVRVVDQEELQQTFYTGLEHVLQPDFAINIELEVLLHSLTLDICRSVDEGDLRTAFGNKIVAKFPYFVKRLVSLSQALEFIVLCKTCALFHGQLVSLSL